MRRMARAVLSVMLTAIVAACAGEQAKEAAAPVPVAAAAAPKPAPASAPTVMRVAPKPVPVNPLRDPKNILAKRSVYYDYDSYAVKPEFRPIFRLSLLHLPSCSYSFL